MLILFYATVSCPSVCLSVCLSVTFRYRDLSLILASRDGTHGSRGAKQGTEPPNLTSLTLTTWTPALSTVVVIRCWG